MAGQIWTYDLPVQSCAEQEANAVLMRLYMNQAVTTVAGRLAGKVASASTAGGHQIATVGFPRRCYVAAANRAWDGRAGWAGVGVGDEHDR